MHLQISILRHRWASDKEGSELIYLVGGDGPNYRTRNHSLDLEMKKTKQKSRQKRHQKTVSLTASLKEGREGWRGNNPCKKPCRHDGSAIDQYCSGEQKKKKQASYEPHMYKYWTGNLRQPCCQAGSTGIDRSKHFKSSRLPDQGSERNAARARWP